MSAKRQGKNVIFSLPPKEVLDMYELPFKSCSNTIFFYQILPGVKVVIANPETKGMCADSHLGEVCHVSKLEAVNCV